MKARQLLNRLRLLGSEDIENQLDFVLVVYDRKDDMFLNVKSIVVNRKDKEIEIIYG